jgi:hypothetical protein
MNPPARTVTPERTRPPAAPPPAPPTRATPRTPDDVAVLVRALLRELDPLTEVLVEAILAENPAYGGSTRTTREDLHRSCRTNLEGLLQALTGDLAADRDPLDAPRATGARRAEQGMPLESVLHSYRLGYRTIWEGLVAQARSIGPGYGHVDALVDAASIVWEIVDQFSSAVADSYRRTEAVIAREGDRRREALVDALLEGRGAERAVVADAASALDLPEHGPYVVLVLDGTRAGGRAADALAVRGFRTAWRERADREVCLVSLGTAAPADVLDALKVVPDARAGVSPVVDGLAEVDVGQALAQTALTARPPGRAAVAELDARLPGALLVTAPDLAGRLMRRALGGLLDLEPAERDLLLGTLATWLDTGGSAGQTATRLYCHRNTVLNRLRRVEALTGRSLERVDHLVECSLALLARDLLRDAAPGSPPGR